MLNYSELELQSLLDLLVEHTNEYSKMRTFSACTEEQLAQRKQALWELQVLIKSKIVQIGDTMDYIIPDLPDYDTLPQNPNQEQPLQ